MRVKIALVGLPILVLIATRDSASWRASTSVFINAPSPHFTSSTSESMPSAIFLLRILLQISGMLSTVPVTSRRA